MKKGIIFSGCSFTWGQGLWMYYDKDIKIPMSIEYTGGRDNMDVEWKSTRVPEEAYELHKTLGWPTKVAEYLNGTPIIKRYNGGNDEESIRFINEVFGNTDISNISPNTSGIKIIIISIQLLVIYKGTHNPCEIFRSVGAMVSCAVIFSPRIAIYIRVIHPYITRNIEWIVV